MCKANIDYPMHRRIIPSKILVAVDGSQGSRRAADYAFDIAGKDIGTCTLYLVHVIPPQVRLTYSSGYFGVVPTDVRNEIEEEAKEWFNRILAKVRKRDNLYIIKKIISTGASIVAEIANFADEKHIDLIVVGATGKSGLRKLLLGSVSSGLVTHSHCSVMIIR
jgi:nucleotide-binding universal stress UspA family protein